MSSTLYYEGEVNLLTNSDDQKKVWLQIFECHHGFIIKIVENRFKSSENNVEVFASKDEAVKIAEKTCEAVSYYNKCQLKKK